MNKEELQNKIEDLEKQLAEVKEQVNSIEDERIKKGVRWKPEYNKGYAFLTSEGDIRCTTWENRTKDIFRFNTGNCFKTEQEAKECKENLLTKQALKDLALELNNGVEIDWENDEQLKYCIFLSSRPCAKSIYLGENSFYKTEGATYCLDVKFLTIAKNRIGEEKLIKLIKSGV